ncbi:hypothetical protein GCM10007888_28810 [Methylobacterium oxalidis]|uniref:ABC transmembrane type-1 domain-containing protein n=1 Tax=Methylobacterium oxalidis TaxID=944322 RepID=A0ABQ6DI08_9HYPH|nr:hypothetical protein GCM10007888_28810 [Methylobacterium oxalidis]
MNRDEAGEDWRSVSTRTPDEKMISLADARANEPGRGRTAVRPEQIPAPGWRDILWRVVLSLPEDRVLATAGGVAFFALLATFPGLATIVSLYALFSNPNAIGQHLSLCSRVCSRTGCWIFSMTSWCASRARAVAPSAPPRSSASSSPSGAPTRA